MLKDEDINRLEQIWQVLSDLFQDLARRNISVDSASDLRDCKTLIHFIRTSVAHPSKESAKINDSLGNVLQILGKIRSDLISEAMRLNENYVRQWMEKIGKAERGESGYAMIYGSSEFAPGLPEDSEE